MKCRTTWPVSAVLIALAAHSYPPHLSNGLAVGRPGGMEARSSSPDHLAFQADAGVQLNQLEARIDQYATDPRHTASAEPLSRELTDARQQLESLRQAEGVNWQTGTAQYQQSVQRLQHDLDQASAQ